MAKDLLRQTRDYFKAQGIPEIDASLLLEHLLECSRSEVQLKLLRMSDEEVDALDRELRRLVLRRQNGEPIQYITGTAPFRYLEYQVGPGVLIPRPETESLVSLVVEEIDKSGSQSQTLIDLGSGSGCIAISLASERKNLAVTAVENSKGAFAWLEQNIATLAPQVRAVLGSAESACKGETFDYVVANPPYIPVGQPLPVEVRKEPESALFGGDKAGIAIPAAFLTAATRLLKTGGFLAVEHHETQGSLIADLLAAKYTDIKTIKDLTGRVRFTTARKS